MIMKKYILAFCAFSLLVSSCGGWLDVRGENIQKEKNQYETYKGFRDALTGCYMTMSDNSIYGKNLTMTHIENLADSWFFNESFKDNVEPQYSLSFHKYTTDAGRASINSMYAGLFTTISSANVIIKNIAENGGNIGDEKICNMIHGEALAIRAYCQFDVLRMFGQLPKDGTKKVLLPYSYTTSIDEMPSYYDYDAYVANIISDVTTAENLLKESDPIMSSTFSALNNTSNVNDIFLAYRQARLNYWAVRALHARIDMYIGNTAEAHDIALQIINAKNADGSNVISLSGVSDLKAGYNALPNECLFYISKYDVNSYANNDLIGGRSVQGRDFHYLLTNNMLNDLFASLPNSTASHNRYLYLWNRNIKNITSQTTPALKKYWYDESKASTHNLMTQYQIVPMIRLSEMYLIAMESSNSLEEVLSLYSTYMSDREFTLYTPFTSLDEVKAEIPNEYQREFIGEGQMFYVYKRLAAKKMRWNSEQIKEDDYILPLPSSEYNPNNKN